MEVTYHYYVGVHICGHAHIYAIWSWKYLTFTYMFRISMSSCFLGWYGAVLISFGLKSILSMKSISYACLFPSSICLEYLSQPFNVRYLLSLIVLCFLQRAKLQVLYHIAVFFVTLRWGGWGVETITLRVIMERCVLKLKDCCFCLAFCGGLGPQEAFLRPWCMKKKYSSFLNKEHAWQSQ